MTDYPLAELLKLSPAERIQLAQDLWDSIDPRIDAPPLSEEQIAELERRLADHDADPSNASSWDVVRERLARRFGG